MTTLTEKAFAHAISVAEKDYCVDVWSMYSDLGNLDLSLNDYNTCRDSYVLVLEEIKKVADDLTFESDTYEIHTGIIMEAIGDSIYTLQEDDTSYRTARLIHAIETVGLDTLVDQVTDKGVDIQDMQDAGISDYIVSIIDEDLHLTSLRILDQIIVGAFERFVEEAEFDQYVAENA